MNPIMDIDRYDTLSDDNKREITRWVNRHRIYDACCIAAETEGSVLVHRPARPITWFGSCVHDMTRVGIRHRTTVDDPPPWVSPTWDDQQGQR